MGEDGSMMLLMAGWSAENIVKEVVTDLGPPDVNGHSCYRLRYGMHCIDLAWTLTAGRRS